MPTTISAKIVADSICPRGHRITSMLLTFPRYILAEFNTHRMFSRNSASSRAIPFKKMVHAVKSDSFIPLQWMKDHKGMQGNEFLKGFKAKLCSFFWILASRVAILMARILHMIGLTKQLCNRILEPFMWHTVLITATEWDNFFFQRANDGADIHMQTLAYAMLDAINNSVPLQKQEGEWHIPFEQQISDELLNAYWVVNSDETIEDIDDGTFAKLKVKIATSKAARISYTLIGEEKKQNYAADIGLHDKLWAYPHPSPFEHCAQVPTQYEYDVNVHQIHIIRRDIQMGWFGNFRGWKQYRKMLPNENHSFDSRLKR